MERIAPLNIDCLPEAAVSGAILFQDEYRTFLMFNAVRTADYVAIGRAVVEFDRCYITKFGYPNDEAWYAIPRTRTLSYGSYEVFESDWTDEINRLNRHGFPDTPDVELRHFLFLFHDSAFECLAGGFSVSISTEPLPSLMTNLVSRIRE